MAMAAAHHWQSCRTASLPPRRETQRMQLRPQQASCARLPGSQQNPVAPCCQRFCHRCPRPPGAQQTLCHPPGTALLLNQPLLPSSPGIHRQELARGILAQWRLYIHKAALVQVSLRPPQLLSLGAKRRVLAHQRQQRRPN
jgi:hypothetical protein